MSEKLYYINDPFVLGSQAGLVYYVKNNDSENWYTVVKVKSRNVFDFPQDEDDSKPYQLNEFNNTYIAGEASSVDQVEILNRVDIDGTYLDEHIVSQEEKLKESDDASDFDTDDDYEDESSTYGDDYVENVDSDLE
ncbi:unnamed protein product [Trifolium pratense]|uniref:Uncharacterized protein n=1 Tax=Trifolium pratense TaxID=57577 RepID=A0ACB0IZ72_TRIPR|nr:unnamed protein product [Trifolium pratense]